MLRLIPASLHSPGAYRAVADPRFQPAGYLALIALLETIGFMLVLLAWLLVARHAFLTDPTYEPRVLADHVAARMPVLIFRDNRLSLDGESRHVIDWPDRAEPLIVIDTSSKPKSGAETPAAPLRLYARHYELYGDRKTYPSVPDGRYTGAALRDRLTGLANALPAPDGAALTFILIMLPVIIGTATAAYMIIMLALALVLTLFGAAVAAAGFRLDLSFPTLFRIALLALTPSMLIGLAAGFAVSLTGQLYFMGWIATLGIGACYMLFGLRAIAAARPPAIT